ncbi:MAG: STAS domain-containing protein [Gemmataceae bacterium]
MKLYLIVAKGKHQGMPIEIKKDLFLMGSDKMCQLRSKMPGIAAQHCAIVTRDEKKVFVRDLGGGETLVNNDLVPANSEWPLHAGDRLVVGPLEFNIQFQEKQLNQRDLEEWALKSLDVEAKREKREIEEDDPFEPGVKGHSSANAASAAGAILDRLAAMRGQVKGRLRVSREGDITVLRFNDVYLVEEAEIAFIKKELIDNLGRQGMRVLLDFKNVKRLSSVGAEMVQEVFRRIRAQAGSLAMCRLNPDLHMAFQTLGILDSIKLFNNKDEACAAKW